MQNTSVISLSLTPRQRTSVYSHPMRIIQTALPLYSKWRTGTGTQSSRIWTIIFQDSEELWIQCFRSICARAGLKDICLPDVMASLIPMRHSQGSSTPWVHSMQSGSKYATSCLGERRSLHSTSLCVQLYGSRTTTDSHIRIPDLWIISPTKKLTLYVYIFLQIPIHSFRRWTIA